MCGRAMQRVWWSVIRLFPRADGVDAMNSSDATIAEALERFDRRFIATHRNCRVLLAAGEETLAEVG